MTTELLTKIEELEGKISGLKNEYHGRIDETNETIEELRRVLYNATRNMTINDVMSSATQLVEDDWETILEVRSNEYMKKGC